MIDTRLCKTQEELEAAMVYEHNKKLLHSYKSRLSNLLTNRGILPWINLDWVSLDWMINHTEERIKQLEKDITAFEKQYSYMIVEKGGDVSYLTTKN